MSIEYISSGPGKTVMCITFPPTPPESASDRQKIREYHQQIHESEGFYVGERPVKSRPYIGSGITRHSANDEKAIAAAKFAVEASDHNKGEDCGGRLEFRKVVRVNIMRAAVFVYYITLQGSDQCFYEAKVLENIHHLTYQLKMFRPAQHYKE
ncbi:Proteinase inhibitor I25, cystatin, conserved region [Trema orientale]|uniref:Proteinase inhibitor I25, cystatin, conserved region n=1 Tax=Trema orientale TaxID=63057 RepID=A0A2P5FUX7_TREOI|nr:Proteinase inhibitor I25, cystatin, conserved region [Trema orientale]